jgi:hypothetical protein
MEGNAGGSGNAVMDALRRRGSLVAVATEAKLRVHSTSPDLVHLLGGYRRAARKGRKWQRQVDDHDGRLNAILERQT